MSVRSLSSSPHLAPLIVGLLVLVPRLATACSVWKVPWLPVRP